MDKNYFTYGIEISDVYWEGTPASVRQLVEKMGQHIKQSEKELADLEAQRQELLEKILRRRLANPKGDVPVLALKLKLEVSLCKGC